MSFLWRLLPSHELLRVPALRWLLLARFCGDLFFYSTTIVLFQQERGLNYTAMFTMEAILSGTIWLFDIPTSVWAERIGYARMMLLGRVAGLLGMIVYVGAYGFWMFAFSEVLGGIALAAISGCESALLYAHLSVEERKSRGGAAFVLLTSASSAGFFLGLFSGSFIGALSPTLAAICSIAPALVALLATLRLTHYSRTITLEQKSERVRLATILGITWRTIRLQPLLVGLSISRSLAFALTNAIFWYNQPYFKQAGIPIMLFGPLMAGAMGLQLLLLLRITTFQARLGTRWLLALSCLLPGLCYLALTWLPAALPTTGLIAGIVIFSAWQQPVVEMELNSRIGDISRATTLSALGLLGALAKSILDPLIGHLGDQGLATVSLGLGSALLILSLCMVLLIPRKQGKYPS